VILKKTPILNRALKSTDYGATEIEKTADKAAKQKKARASIDRRELLEDAIDEVREYPETYESVEYDLVKEAVGEPPYDATQKRLVADLRKKFRIGADAGEMSRELDSIVDATYLDDKVRRIKSYKDVLSDEEFVKLIKDGVKYKVISEALMKRLQGEGLLD